MLRLFPIALLVIASLRAEGRELCGQHFPTREALERTLKANPSVRAFPPASGIMAMFGPRRTIWWFTVGPDPAYPAVVCMEQAKRSGGYVDLPVQSDCGRASKKECRALAGRMAHVKF